MGAAATPRGGFTIEVADTGIGIAPENIPKAMETLGQIDNTLSRKYEGAGLGLPLTKALAEIHGGSLELESKVGAGTTATVYFPSRRPAREAPNTAELEPALHRKLGSQRP